MEDGSVTLILPRTGMKLLASFQRPWCWERLREGGEAGNRGWDGWMVSPTQRIWVWANSGRQWRTGKPDVLQSMGSQRVRHSLATEWKKPGQCCKHIYLFIAIESFDGDKRFSMNQNTGFERAQKREWKDHIITDQDRGRIIQSS